MAQCQCLNEATMTIPIDLDALIEEYADKAEKVYESRTAGDFTWHGLLSEFSRKARQDRIPVCGGCLKSLLGLEE